MLCLQHQHGGRIPTAELQTQCERIADGQQVYRKFKHDKDGSYNERLQIEMQKRKEKGIKARQSANKRWDKGKLKTECESNANAMRSEDVNENRNITNTKGGVIGGDWLSAKNSFLQDDQWKYKICTAKNLGKAYLEEMMLTFISDIELKEDYKSNKELKSHFTNWLNLKTKKNVTRSTKNPGLYELLEDLRHTHTENTFIQKGSTGT